VTEMLPGNGAAGEDLGDEEGGARALGRDPFADLAEPDPFAEKLELLERIPRLRAAPPPRPLRARRPRPRPAAEEGEPPPARPLHRRWAATPPVAEVDLPEPRGLVDRVLGEHQRRVLASLGQLVEGEASYDRYGFSPSVMRAAFPAFYALYRLYFRVKSSGHENIPSEGPAVLVANHAGLLPFDGAMGVVDVSLHTDPPRLPRSVVDKWAGTLPWINVFYARAGQVIGTRENVADLLDDGQLLLVFPEGMDGIRKPITQRYRLQNFRVGFIEHALRASAPIIPMAFVGTDDQSPILYDVKPLARRLGLPVAPITPTFPWLGPLGLLPYPVSYRIVYGEPLRFHERFGPQGADDPRLVRYLANQARRAVQSLLDRNRS